jgi:hypothetical protein
VATAGARAGSGTRGLGLAARNLLFTAIMIASFAVAVNYIARYAVQHAFIKLRMPAVTMPSFKVFGQPKYLLRGQNDYIIYTNMKVKMVDAATDGKQLPEISISGVSVNEARPEYVKALKQALGVDKKYLKGVSEVSLRDPANIMMIETDGARIIFGDSITKEKLDNYMISLEKMGSLGKSFRSMDLRYDNRVILN